MTSWMRVELQLHAVLAQPLLGLDERASDVAILDQAVGERQPARPRVALRGRRAGVGHGDDDVGLGRRLGREPLAHPDARGVEADAVHPRVGPREVDELEDAERRAAALAHRLRLRDARPVVVEDRHLAGLDVAHVAGADDVERARLRRHHRERRRDRPSRAGGSRRGRGTRSPARRRRRPPRTRRGSGPSRRGRPPRACRGARRSGPRSPRCRTSSRAGRRAPRARCAARRYSSGCRCDRARRCGPGGGASPAACSASGTTRWSSSACGRSRSRHPTARVRLTSSNTCGTRPSSFWVVIRRPSPTAMPADSWPRCCSA